MVLLSTLALIAGAANALPSRQIRATGPAAFASSNDGTYKLSSYDAPVSGNGDPGSISSTWKLSIDDTSSGHKQTIDGFGAAITDATVQVFNSLPDDQKSKLLNDLLTPDGVNFSLLRHTIGASDLSPEVYTYDDSSDDKDLNNFDLGDYGNAMLGLIKAMKGVNGDIKLLGSPWSAPGFMKLNGVVDGNTDQNNLNPDYIDSYAQYFVKYIQAFQNGGVNVDAITIQNEPLNSQSGYPTMYVYADQAAQWIQNNIGPALQNAGLSTAIWAYDHNTDQPDYPQTVIDGAGQFVNTTAWHCYATNNDWTVLTDFHNKNPNVAQYMTECWTSPDTQWDQAAEFTMGPLQNWGQGSIAWTLGTTGDYQPYLASGGCHNCRGLVTVDTDAGTYDYTVDYYMLGQFSKFIPRGAIVLNGSGSYAYDSGKIESVATVNPDGTRTVVIQNTFGNDVYLTLTTQSGETWSGPIYQESVVTWQLPAASSS